MVNPGSVARKRSAANEAESGEPKSEPESEE
jgi:hypothetical protein